MSTIFIPAYQGKFATLIISTFTVTGIKKVTGIIIVLLTIDEKDCLTFLKFYL